MILAQPAQNYSEQFAQERARLLSTLGELVDGGIVEQVEHLGATSTGGVVAEARIDIGLSIWPFPVDAEHEVVLQALGYVPVLRDARSAPQRWERIDSTFHLIFFEAGSASWSDYRITNEYLLYNGTARLTYATRKQAWAANSGVDTPDYERAKREFFFELLVEARQWWIAWQGWAPVEFVREELLEFRCPWFISGGWALDLYLGRVRRVHEDVDIVFSRGDQLVLQEYLSGRGWRWTAPSEGRIEPWPAQLYLDPSRHQIFAHRRGAFIDFLLTEMDHDVWHYRRNRNIIRAAERASLVSSSGIPYLAPELVLLFKSKNTSGKERNKDETDFQEVFPHLEPERRGWLHGALVATEPAHPWVQQYESILRSSMRPS